MYSSMRINLGLIADEAKMDTLLITYGHSTDKYRIPEQTWLMQTNFSSKSGNVKANGSSCDTKSESVLLVANAVFSVIIAEPNIS